ncbi:unnamed protein product [Leptosia nina]|uniref:Uncharacterized protein n=1 Tax=Leptosia nina TaxID=320188 RepID=A0AAV1K5X0_9NEOP
MVKLLRRVFDLYVLIALYNYNYVNCDSDLQCYVCTDCEHNYENTKTTCKDVHQTEQGTPGLPDTTTIREELKTTDETLTSTTISDPITSTDTTFSTDETACTFESDLTTSRTNLDITRSTLSSATRDTTTTDSSSYVTTEREFSTVKTKDDLGTTAGSSALDEDSRLTNLPDTNSTTSAGAAEKGTTFSYETTDTAQSTRYDTSTLSNQDGTLQTETSTQNDVESSTANEPKTSTTYNDSQSTVTTTISNQSTDSLNKDVNPTSSTSNRVTTTLNSDRTSFVPTEPSVTITHQPTEDSESTTYNNNFTNSLRSDSTEPAATSTTTSKENLETTIPSYIETSTQIYDSTSVSTETDFETVTEENFASENINDVPNVQMVDEGKYYDPRYRFRRAVKNSDTTKPRCVVTAFQEKNRTIVVRGCSFGQDMTPQKHCNSLLDTKFSGNTRVQAENSGVSQTSNESNDAEKTDSQRMGAVAHAVAGGGGFQYRPGPLPTPAALLVECHVCTDCPKVHEDTPSKLCPFTLDPNKRGKCITYAEKYRHMHRPWYIRGCASERGSCEDIRRAHGNHADMVDLIFCRECEGDRCNTSAASTIVESTIALIALIVAPVVTKFTLS